MALIYAGNKLNKNSLIEKGFSKDFIQKGFIKYYIPLILIDLTYLPKIFIVKYIYFPCKQRRFMIYVTHAY